MDGSEGRFFVHSALQGQEIGVAMKREKRSTHSLVRLCAATEPKVHRRARQVEPEWRNGSVRGHPPESLFDLPRARETRIEKGSTHSLVRFRVAK